MYVRTNFIRETSDVSCGTDDTVHEGVRIVAITVVTENEAAYDDDNSVPIGTSVAPVACVSNDDVHKNQTETEITHEQMQFKNVINTSDIQTNNKHNNSMKSTKQTQKQIHSVTAVCKKEKRRNKRRKPLYFDEPVTDKNADGMSQTTDANETTMTSLNNNDDLTATGHLAVDPSEKIASDVPGTSADPLNEGTTHEPTDDNDSSGISITTQLNDPDFHHIINYLLYGTLPTDDQAARRTLLLSDYYVILDGKLFHLMTSRRKNTKMQECLIKQLCIPAKMRSEILNKFHSQLMHVGSEKMYLTMRSKIYWPNLYNDVRLFVGQCQICYQVKANTHAKKAKVQIRKIPKTLFHTIHLDHLKLAVPNATHQYNYVLIIIDELSLQVELIPTKTTSASECANALFSHWICHYGTPSTVITDRHRSFTAGLTQCLFRLCGIKHMLISTKNPKSNGLCEQVNSRIINAIKIHCSTHGNWPQLLPAIAGAYRAAVTPTRQYSPFFLLYGCDMQLPIDFDCANTLPAHVRQDPNVDIFSDRMKILRSEVQQFAQNNRERATADINKNKTQTEYKIGQKVYLANETIKPDEYKKSAVRYTGPYIIVGKSEHNTYKLSHIYTGKILKSFIHFDKLRPTTEERKSRKTSRKESQDEDGSDKPTHHNSCASEVGDKPTLTRRRSVIIRGRTSRPRLDPRPDDDGSIKDAEPVVISTTAPLSPSEPDVTGSGLVGLSDDVPDPATQNQNNGQNADNENDRMRHNISNIEVKRDSTALEETHVNGNNTTKRDQCTESKQGSELCSDATTMFAFNHNYFDEDEEDIYNEDPSVESTMSPPLSDFTERSQRHLHKRHSEMKRILKTARIQGSIRCHVLLNNGERVVCRPVQIPSHLLCKFRLHKYNKKHPKT